MNCRLRTNVALVLSLLMIQGSVALLLNFYFLSLGGQCSTSIRGCQCLDEWSYNGEENSGCANPGGLTKDPWCVVDPDTCTPRGTLEDGQSFDYCTAGCKQTPTLELEDTYLGCKCSSSWRFQGQVYAGCSNPDNDILGNWCIVEQESCSSILAEQLLGIIVEEEARFDYCARQPDQVKIGVDRTSSVFWMYLQGFGQDYSSQSELQLPGQTQQSAARAFIVCQPLMKALSKIEDLVLFAKILKETGLQEVIKKTSKELTIFAPTDAAFEQFAMNNNITVEDLFLFQTNKVMMGQVASLHVITESLNNAELLKSDGASIPTLIRTVSLEIQVEGKMVQISTANELVSTSANVLSNTQGTKVCEGELFAVDALLVG
eukprot:TRINITY_DN1462_c1_g1_i3.p1 TRINITY_DN1462_c1_g1~~TRINITY_DN1462_c1_g1_i3.p1  ORF type:complete len:375 (-),score=33.49 TRINITY_DN1462_c1_g1_i3:228-1352(-)